MSSEKKKSRKHKRTETISDSRLREIWENTDSQNLNNQVVFENVTNEELKKVDGYYLRGLVPPAKKKKEKITDEHLEKMELNVLKHLVQRAIDGKYDGEYKIPVITPGIPSYDLKDMQDKLCKKLRQRPGWIVIQSKTDESKLEITWDPEK